MVADSRSATSDSSDPSDPVARIALVVLALPDRRLVFQRRDGGAPVSPHKLGLFGGHVEPGESIPAAMVRELEEETSLRAADCELRQVAELDVPATGGGPDDRLAVAVFTARTARADFAVFEGAGAEVYDREVALSRDDVAPTARAVLEQVTALPPMAPATSGRPATPGRPATS